MAISEDEDARGWRRWSLAYWSITLSIIPISALIVWANTR